MGREIKSLLESNGHRHSPGQILGLVSRRIDYVHENVKAIEKKLAAERDKLDRANFVGARDEGGLPLTEITEELDEDGNIVSTNVSKPSDAAPKILDALRQSGITEDVGEDERISGLSNLKSGGSSTLGKKVEDNISTASEPERSASKKKSVSFAESLQIQEAPGSPQKSTVSSEGHTIKGSLPAGLPSPAKRISEKESLADKALRREMLLYNMEEVGAVVAKMDLNNEEDTDAVSDGDDLDGEELDDDESDLDDDDFDELDNEYEDGDEDSFGRTTRSVVTEKYRHKMQQLERKLNARSIVNAGPEQRNPSSHTADPAKDEPPSKPLSEPRAISSHADVVERPVAADIVERRDGESESSIKIQAPQKVSKFKTSRMREANSQPSVPSSKRFLNGPLAIDQVPAAQTASKRFHSIPLDDTLDAPSPEAPVGKTHVDTLVERPFPRKERRAKEPDDWEPALWNRQIKAEYTRAQNSMIQKEDGFMSVDTEQLEDEGQPKMSRFKAARLARRS